MTDEFASSGGSVIFPCDRTPFSLIVSPSDGDIVWEKPEKAISNPTPGATLFYTVSRMAKMYRVMPSDKGLE